MQDLLDFTDALSVQALLSLHRTKIHERVTEELLLLRRHRPSIQCPGIPPLPNSQLLKLRSKGDQNVNGKLVKLPDQDHPISIERNPSRVVAGRVIADTRNALTLREAAYS